MMKEAGKGREASPFFLIYGHDYTPASAGIRALHVLCHEIRQRGYDAYLAPCVQNPALNTAILIPSNSRKISGRKIIALYPEGVQGNPFNAPVVARWLLNSIQHTFYSRDDIFFSWAHYFNITGIKSEHLWVPVINEDLFRDTHSERSGFCYYANKYIARGGAIPTPIQEKGINLSSVPRGDHAQLARIFNSSEYLVCFEESTITAEAALCGCPTVFYQSEYLKGAPSVTNDGVSGTAISTDTESIREAKRTLHVEVDSYHRKVMESGALIDRFIEMCMARAK